MYLHMDMLQPDLEVLYDRDQHGGHYEINLFVDFYFQEIYQRILKINKLEKNELNKKRHKLPQKKEKKKEIESEFLCMLQVE